MRNAGAVTRLFFSALLGLAATATATAASAQPGAEGGRLRVAVVVAGNVSDATRTVALGAERALDDDARVAQPATVALRAALRGEPGADPADGLTYVRAMRAMTTGDTASDGQTLVAIGAPMGVGCLLVVRAGASGVELVVFDVARAIFAPGALAAGDAVGAAVGAFVLNPVPPTTVTGVQTTPVLPPVPEAPAGLPPIPPAPAWSSVQTAPSLGTPDLRAPSVERSPSAVLWEVLGGVLGYGLGAALFLLPAAGGAGGAAVTIGVFTVPLGIATGIWLPGMLSGGNGGFGWVLLGQALGGLASLPIVLLALSECSFGSSCDGPDAIAIGAVLALPILGGVLAYEQSNDVPRAGARPAAPALASLHLGAGPLGSHGAAVSLFGAF